MVNYVAEVSDRLKSILCQAAEAARSAGKLQYQELPFFVVEVPRDPVHGDFASNLAMVLARQARTAPRQVAEVLLTELNRIQEMDVTVELAGAGFLNFRLAPGWLNPLLPRVLELNRQYGCSNQGQGTKIQVEFVSANPTGLLHMGNARGAALGDTIARLLQAIGCDVTREYYINDAGNQITNFGLSLEARYLQQLGLDAPVPDEGYHGEDLVATAKRVVAEVGSSYLDLEQDNRRQLLTEYALAEKLAAIRAALESFGVDYDTWFSERSLHASGAVRAVLALLEAKGYIDHREGAAWFRASCFGDGKDEVVVRSNELPTYFAADIAYHYDKFQRGFSRVINVWGADHHGHVARMQGAMQALGIDPRRLEVVLMQLVRLYQGGEILKMSKRTGQYVTLTELLDEVGKDAARFFFIMRSADSHLDFDLDLARSQTSDNPVYYVQYAHARICSILRQAEVEDQELIPDQAIKPGLLQHPAEQELLRRIADLPEVVAGAAQTLEVQRLARYAQELATNFHSFYTECRVLVADQPLRLSRLSLIRATQICLRNVLVLMGVNAPERM